MRAGILVCSPYLSIRDFLETNARFVWEEVAGVSVYSCYVSPSDPFEIFETQILLLEESLREAIGRFLIAGDFNSKSPEWGEARLDKREIFVGEVVARNDLIILNRGKDFTFRRGEGGEGVDYRPYDCRFPSCLKASRLVCPRGNNLQSTPVL